jgi:MFS transporter, AAHS family, 4-hydroxybenzoate transporter
MVAYGYNQTNMATAPATVNVTEVIDNSRIGAFHIGLFVLCALCLILDGFDVQAMGFVGPALIADWKLPRADMGKLVSAALVGILIGSLFFSMLADKIGRRPVLIIATLFFAVMTLFTARASTPNELYWLRLVGGIGMGGIMPNVMALVGEYSSRSTRVFVMMLVANGFNAGAALGGVVSGWLIPQYGWRAVFYFCGVMPIAIALLMVLLLPESLQFLTLRGKDPALIGKWLRRIAPAAVPDSNVRYIVQESGSKGVPLVHLFREGRAVGTVLLWVLNFMNLLNVYFLGGYLPTMVSANYSASTAVAVGTTVQIGGTLATVVIGWLAGRFGFVPVLTVGFGLACVNVALIGQPALPLAGLYLAVFLAGWGIIGGQGAINTLAATYYPTDLRSTGIGSGLGVGRIGSILGPLIAGELLRQNWTANELFYAAAIPAGISTIVVFSLRWVMKTKTTAAATERAVIAH